MRVAEDAAGNVMIPLRSLGLWSAMRRDFRSASGKVTSSGAICAVRKSEDARKGLHAFLFKKSCETKCPNLRVRIFQEILNFLTCCLFCHQSKLHPFGFLLFCFWIISLERVDTRNQSLRVEYRSGSSDCDELCFVAPLYRYTPAGRRQKDDQTERYL